MTALGLVAAALTTGCWVPQLLRSWRTQSVQDLSRAFLVVLSSGLVLWLAYGVLRGDPAIMAANGVSLSLLAALAVIKVRAERQKRPPAR
jgi:MtN3 and saliva related transmembrane protein